MLPTPRTYSEWVTVLDTLKKGTDDRGYLQAIANGTIEWQSGVAERFFKRAQESLNARYNEAKDRFTRSQSRARGESDIIHNLLALRKDFQFLKDAANIQAIPENYRSQLIQNIVSMANETQSSLEDSASKNLRRDGGKLANIVRNHKVNQLY